MVRYFKFKLSAQGNGGLYAEGVVGNDFNPVKIEVFKAKNININDLIENFQDVIFNQFVNTQMTLKLLPEEKEGEADKA